MALQLIVPPMVEPVSLSELKAFLRIDDADTSNDAVISGLALAARQWTETYTRRRFIFQTWQLSLDYFPGQIDQRLTGQTFSSPFVAGANALLVGIRFGIVLPFPPVQSIESFLYQNENGQISQMIQGPSTIASVTNIAAQPLTITTSAPHNLQTGSAVTLAGNSSLINFLGGETFENVTVLDATRFFLNGTMGDGTTSISGGGTATGYNFVQDLLSQPARLTPIFGQFWPIARVVTNAVQVQFVCGYGGPVTVSMSANSGALTGATFQSSDIGKPISIPGAGPNGDTLTTLIASVDGSGNATTQVAATTAVSGVVAVLNIPEGIKTGIKLLTTYWYENRVPDESNIPMAVKAVLGPYRDLRV